MSTTESDIQGMRQAALTQMRIGLDAMVKLVRALPPFSEEKASLLRDIDRLRETIRRLES